MSLHIIKTLVHQNTVATVLEEKIKDFSRPILAMFYQVILMIEIFLMEIKQNNMNKFYKGLQIMQATVIIEMNLPGELWT